jgi:hypothetical protein
MTAERRHIVVVRLEIVGEMRSIEAGSSTKLIAVIDDDPFVLEAMGGLLRKWGYEVLTAASGRRWAVAAGRNRRGKWLAGGADLASDETDNSPHPEEPLPYPARHSASKTRVNPLMPGQGKGGGVSKDGLRAMSVRVAILRDGNAKWRGLLRMKTVVGFIRHGADLLRSDHTLLRSQDTSIVSSRPPGRAEAPAIFGLFLVRAVAAAAATRPQADLR